MQLFTPLILLDLDDAQLPPHLCKSDSTERLCQNVSQLLIGAHMFNFHHTIADTLSDE
jgi:hypothetical protein